MTSPAAVLVSDGHNGLVNNLSVDPVIVSDLPHTEPEGVEVHLLRSERGVGGGGQADWPHSGGEGDWLGENQHRDIVAGRDVVERREPVPLGVDDDPLHTNRPGDLGSGPVSHALYKVSQSFFQRQGDGTLKILRGLEIFLDLNWPKFS